MYLIFKLIIYIYFYLLEIIINLISVNGFKLLLWKYRLLCLFTMVNNI